MRENEAAARALAAHLGAAGIEAQVAGAGVHWRVDAAPVARRTLCIHCFWYERAISALMLGMNPANARRRPRDAPSPYEGPEYLVMLNEDGVRVADGRTRSSEEVVACARAWLARVDVEHLVRLVPFIDEKPGAMRAIAERIDPALRREIEEDPSSDLWVYGDGRSCKVFQRGDTVICDFLLGQAHVAWGEGLDDLSAAIAAWLIARPPVSELAAHVPGIELERHAEVIEADPARWHWLHVRDRIGDPHDSLAALRGLIETLAGSPIATAFFSFSSLSRLCFSASSHYPWVAHGLPVVAPIKDGLYMVDGEPCDLDRAVRQIEARLAASPIRPFFGSQPHHELAPLAECLSRQGSALRPQLVQHGAWYALVVADRTGARRCKVSGPDVEFADATDRLDVTWPAFDAAASAIHRYCERGASLDEIAADPAARNVSRRRA